MCGPITAANPSGAALVCLRQARKAVILDQEEELPQAGCTQRAALTAMQSC